MKGCFCGFFWFSEKFFFSLLTRFLMADTFL
jgi:hypothetical protein